MHPIVLFSVFFFFFYLRSRQTQTLSGKLFSHAENAEQAAHRARPDRGEFAENRVSVLLSARVRRAYCRTTTGILAATRWPERVMDMRMFLGTRLIRRGKHRGTPSLPLAPFTSPPLPMVLLFSRGAKLDFFVANYRDSDTVRSKRVFQVLL